MFLHENHFETAADVRQPPEVSHSNTRDGYSTATQV